MPEDQFQNDRTGFIVHSVQAGHPEVNISEGETNTGHRDTHMYLNIYFSFLEHYAIKAQIKNTNTWK